MCLYSKEFKVLVQEKNIATAKVGPDKGNVVQGVGQDEADLQELIIKLISENNKVTKKQIANIASVSEKTVERQMKKMTNVKYVGRWFG